MENENVLDDFENVESSVDLDKVKDVKSRCFGGIIYFDNENHKKAQEMLRNGSYNSLAIIHDRDLDSEGNLKKPHIHFIIKFQNARHLKSVCDELGVEYNLIQKVSGSKGYMRYFTHVDYPEKAQYLVQEAYGTLYSEFCRIMQYDTEDNKVLRIIEHIQNNKGISYTSIVRWCCKEGLYDVLRRSYSIIKDIKLEFEEYTRYNMRDFLEK